VLFLFYVYLACLVVGGVLVGASLLMGHGGGEAEHELEAGGDASAEHEIEHDGEIDHDHDLEHDADADHDADYDHDLEHDVDHDHDLGHDAEHDHEVDAGHDHELAHDHDHDAGHDAGHAEEALLAHGHVAGAGAGAGGTTDALWLPFFSMRFWTFFLAFFGLTGTVLSGLQLAGSIPTLMLALLVGGGTGTTAAYAIRRLRGQTIGLVEGMQDFVGRDGVALLPVSRERPGKIRIQSAGRDIELLAYAVDGKAIEAHQPVLVIGPREDGVEVCRLPEGEADPTAGAMAETSGATDATDTTEVAERAAAGAARATSETSKLK
jgi:hypothetical protein